VAVTASRGRTALARGTARLARAGSATLALKLTRAGRRTLGRSRRLRVSLSARARDAVGNSDTQKVAVTLRR
jgi:hypothetical protein